MIEVFMKISICNLSLRLIIITKSIIERLIHAPELLEYNKKKKSKILFFNFIFF